MRLHASALTLPLRNPFTITRGTQTEIQNVLLRLNHDGIEAFGEAAPRKYYGQNQASCLLALLRFQTFCAKFTPFDLDYLTAAAAIDQPYQEAAQMAFDIALHDWIGKKLNIPLWKYFGLVPAWAPPTSVTIGMGDPAFIEKRMHELRSYPILKVKLGAPNDMEALKRIRKLAPRKTLRVDANCGWTVRSALERARTLRKLEIEFVEQPIPAGNMRGLKTLHEKMGIPIFTDESSVTAEDAPNLRGAVTGINVKLAKCGGLRNAIQMIHAARACGLEVMLGCMLESTCAITAAAHIASMCDYVDLDGAIDLKVDPFSGVKIMSDGKLKLPSGPGLGLKVNPRILKAYS